MSAIMIIGAVLAAIVIREIYERVELRRWNRQFDKDLAEYRNRLNL